MLIPHLPSFPPPEPASRSRRRATDVPASDPCRRAVELAARHTGLPVAELLGTGRGERRCSSARALAMYLAHVGLGVPMRGVARGFSRHPSTVAHACRRIEERREVVGWDRRVGELEEELRRLMACGEVSHGA